MSSSLVFSVGVGLLLGGAYILLKAISCRNELMLRRHCIVGGLAVFVGSFLVMNFPHP